MSSFTRKPHLISMFFFPSLCRSWKQLQSNKIQGFVFLRVWPCIYKPTDLCVFSHCVTLTSHHSRFIVNGGLILSYLLSELITSKQVDLLQPRLVDWTSESLFSAPPEGQKKKKNSQRETSPCFYLLQRTLAVWTRLNFPAPICPLILFSHIWWLVSHCPLDFSQSDTVVQS